MQIIKAAIAILAVAPAVLAQSSTSTKTPVATPTVAPTTGVKTKTFSGQGTCTNPLIRKEFRELNPTERQSFIDAVKCLRDPKRSPSVIKTNKSPTMYDDLVFLHGQFADVTHRSAQFLPWHRQMLALMEYWLRAQCGYQGALPYWDWTIDSQAPERSELFSAQWFGGNGKQASNWCVTDGQFADTLTTFVVESGKHCIHRKWSGGSSFGKQFPSLASAPFVQNLLDTSKDSYNTFRENLEFGPHNRVHATMGGDMGYTNISPNDVLFFLHHNNVDRTWARWQTANPTLAATYNGPSNPASEAMDAKATDMMPFGGLYPDIPVNKVFSTTSGDILCYKFSNSVAPNSVAFNNKAALSARNARRAAPANVTATLAAAQAITPNPSDRDDKLRLRSTVPLTDAWLQQMKFTPKQVAKIRADEEYAEKFVAAVNAAGYVSQNALTFTEAADDVRPRTAEESALHARLLSILARNVNAFIKGDKSTPAVTDASFVALNKLWTKA
ncbi:uncharacterized protein EV422DRAFT_410468 [Fimicolochytrium jonesii]|uniref:uncharacterized protein n=1 Tax=Fimicolochytrium jonesii TaxID=1396493 RepID=UPI0022FE8DBD|nr:uncharacterized protein EV422DRAFT_410468 [Fimicolochytrium jonesii]KAI8822694.1 hypothetical protein EV422DRAFT_410468 [Fimicolochytrium jonesii]